MSIEADRVRQERTRPDAVPKEHAQSRQAIAHAERSAEFAQDVKRVDCGAVAGLPLFDPLSQLANLVNRLL